MNIKNNLLPAIFILFFIFWNALNGFAQTTVLDTDTQQPFAGFGQHFINPQKPEKQKETMPSSATESEAVFKILSINNISGNNPFNPVQPVFNFGGVVVGSVDDLVNCIRGGICRAGQKEFTISCSPSTGTSNMAVFKDSVGCYLKSNATVCRVEQLPSMGDLLYETFFVMYDAFWAKSNVVGTAGNKTEYVMTKPPSSDAVVWPGGDTVYKIGTGTYTLEVRHKVSGVNYRIQFTVQQLAGNDIRLTVNSLVKI